MRNGTRYASSGARLSYHRYAFALAATGTAIALATAVDQIVFVFAGLHATDFRMVKESGFMLKKEFLKFWIPVPKEQPWNWLCVIIIVRIENTSDPFLNTRRSPLPKAFL